VTKVRWECMVCGRAPEFYSYAHQGFMCGKVKCLRKAGMHLVPKSLKRKVGKKK
jgi:hypothetical protein